ncbi:unnamed protein product [Orchesella dallaii]|uniref:Uncharacterized protein n=1 Tax=Orchesella dallaii TaxID=48710 RepID=A0ABP1RVD3_9HEXA
MKFFKILFFTVTCVFIETLAQHANHKPAKPASFPISADDDQCQLCSSFCENHMCCDDGFSKCGISDQKCVCFQSDFVPERRPLPIAVQPVPIAVQPVPIAVPPVPTTVQPVPIAVQPVWVPKPVE